MGVHCEAMGSSSLTSLGMSMVHNISPRNLLRTSEESIKVGTIWLTSPTKYR
ncbi:hypothetical protein YC2023_058887 [Brassica napus]